MVAKERKKKRKKFVQKLRLDVGCGGSKQPGFIGMDKRKLDGVDLVHDAEDIPYPLEDGSCEIITVNHVIEHIKPWLQVDIMNEFWRLLIPKGFLFIVTPYGGSYRWHMDPTHCASWNETTPFYFSPYNQQRDTQKKPVLSLLYKVYEPLPWIVEQLRYTKKGDVNVAFRKAGADE